MMIMEEKKEREREQERLTWRLAGVLDDVGPSAVGQTRASSGALKPSITYSADSSAGKGDWICGILEIADRASDSCNNK